MNEYYKQELLLMIEQWPDERVQQYIHELEQRLENTKEHLRALRAIKKRKGRNKNPKDTGTRGGL
jgi:hypothetical protein